MARYKTELLLITLLLFAGTASALSFNVNVPSITSSSEYAINYQEEVNASQNASASIANRGSIGCQFRLKGDFKYGNKTVTRFSKPYPTWPGETADTTLYFIPINYTGQVDVNLSSTYCDQEKPIESFSFTVNEKAVPEKDLESQTLDVRHNSTDVKIANVSEGILVPEKTPPYWKAGSAEIRNGQLTINYEAPIFRRGENLTYTILDENNSVVGRTDIWLREPPEENILDRIELDLMETGLVVSMLFNFLLLMLLLKTREK